MSNKRIAAVQRLSLTLLYVSLATLASLAAPQVAAAEESLTDKPAQTAPIMDRAETVEAVEVSNTTVSYFYDLSINHNSVSGAGASQSYLPRGSYFLGEFEYNLATRKDEGNFSLRLRSRATDDRMTDRQTWALSNVEMKFWDQDRELTLGDFYADFSQYSLNGTLKGAKYSLKSGGQSEWHIVGGVAYPRWENFWSGARHKAIRRSVQGLNFRDTAGALTYGVTALRSSDSDRITVFDEMHDNKLIAINWVYEVKDGMTLKGESAFSSGEVSPGDTQPAVKRHGDAHQLLWNHSLRHRRWAYEYEYVSPFFTTLTGSAIVDRERMKLRYRHGVDADTSVQLGVSWFHDQLSGSTKLDRIDVWQPELTVSLNEPFNRPDATLDLRLGLDRRYDSTLSTVDKNIGLSYRDRIGETDLDLSLEHARFNTRPHAMGTKSNEYNLFCSLSTRMDKGSAVLRPSLHLGAWRNRNVMEAYSDRMVEASVGLGYERPAEKFTAALRIGQKYSNNAKIDDSRRWFASLNLEAQPAYLHWLGTNVKHYLRVGINDYRYDDTGRNYRETSVATGIRVDI